MDAVLDLLADVHEYIKWCNDYFYLLRRFGELGRPELLYYFSVKALTALFHFYVGHPSPLDPPVVTQKAVKKGAKSVKRSQAEDDAPSMEEIARGRGLSVPLIKRLRRVPSKKIREKHARKIAPDLFPLFAALVRCVPLPLTASAATAEQTPSATPMQEISQSQPSVLQPTPDQQPASPSIQSIRNSVFRLDADQLLFLVRPIVHIPYAVLICVGTI